MGRNSLNGNIYDSLSSSKPDSIGNQTCGDIGKWNWNNSSKLHCNDSDGNPLNSTAKFQQDNARTPLWTYKIITILHWSGVHSLEIYLIHGLVLNDLKASEIPAFQSIKGIGLVSMNYIITILICVNTINLLRSNKIICKVLSLR